MRRLGFDPNPDPAKMNVECLEAAEEAANEVLKCIHPTLDSDERRKDVVDYIQSLITDYLGYQVFPYGSVPLKTYLPDGDIDLTAIHAPLVDDYLPKAVFSVLQEEELNENREYKVKNIQFIDAEVKLVKCHVQNILIDISFNQLGGLCTLCFLEQVDRLVGNDHLFKRSILLVKTWCYHESRILGSHHGLISTYALETLVLYIFHLFHSSLTGPLAVLYRFLDYYNKFDWNKFCISLKGPVSKSTLPDIVVEKPDNEGNKFLLSEDFLRDCMDMFSVSSNGDVPKTFPAKYLNIIDPLKEYNNLGRSVHRGNFYRIQSAFRYGARNLGRILSLPRHRITDEIKSFFANTLKRYPCNNGCYMPKRIYAEGSIDFSDFSSDEEILEDDMLLISSDCDFEDDSIGMEKKCTSTYVDEPCKYPKFRVSSQALSESYSADGAAGSENFHVDGFVDLSGSTSQLGDVISDCSRNQSFQSESQLCPAPCTENRDPQFGISSQTGIVNVSSGDKHGMIYAKPSAVSSSQTGNLENFSLDFWLKDLSDMENYVEPLDPPSDLTGDYDSYVRNLLYGQIYSGVALSAQVVTYSHLPSSPSQFPGENPWDTFQQSVPLQWDSYPQHNLNVGYAEPYIDSSVDFGSPSICLSNEDIFTARGTGTYFPNQNFCSKEEPLKGGKVGNKKSKGNKLRRDTHKKGASSAPPERSFASGYEDHHSQPLVHKTQVKEISNSSTGIQFGSFGTSPVIPPGSSENSGPSSNLLQKLTSMSENKEHERVVEHSFHLKDEEEFPALRTNGGKK